MIRRTSNNRAAFGHQPVQHLMLDLGFPMTPLSIRTTASAVQNVLTLACSIRGGTRIPGFGLSTINNTFQSVWKLEDIRGNFIKIEEALNSLQSLAQINERISMQEFSDCLHLAIVSVMNEFTSKFEYVADTNKRSFPAQIQITLITKKSGVQIQECLEEMLQSMTTSKLKKIQVIEMSNTLNTSLHQREEVTTNISKTMGFVDLILMPATESHLEQFFKSWLLDCDTDFEHLCIMFPGPTSQEPIFTLKCDISESLINPLSLPFGHRYQIQTDFFSIQLGGSGVAKTTASDLPVYELQVIGLLSSSGLCESLLFGQPERLLPTQCWRLEWTEQLANQNYFMALCRQLLIREQYLLTKLKPQYRTDHLSGYFILVASHNALLLKAVAPAELVLPYREMEQTCCSPIEQLPDSLITAMQGALNQLPLIDDFNPGEFSSGLYSALGRNLLHNYNLNDDTSSKLVPSCHPALDPPGQGSTMRGRGKKRRVQQHVL